MDLIWGALALPVQAALVLGAALLWPNLAAWPPQLPMTARWRWLWHKQVVVPTDASWMFRLAPAISLAGAATAALLVPVFTTASLASPAADILLILGLLGLSEAARWLAALDAGTSPSGGEMARALAAAVPALPALLIGVAALGVFSGGTLVSTMVARAVPAAPLLLLLAASLLLAGGKAEAVERLAVDYGGRDLALLLLAGALSRIAVLGLMADLLLPWRPDWGWLGALLAWVAKLAVLQAGLALGAGFWPSPTRAAGLATLLALAASWMLGQVPE